MLPKFDIASETPRPVDRIEVGKVSAEMRLNRAKATVLKSLLMPIKIMSPNCDFENCTQMPNIPETNISKMIQNFRFISWQKKLVKKQLTNSRQPMTSMLT